VLTTASTAADAQARCSGSPGSLTIASLAGNKGHAYGTALKPVPRLGLHPPTQFHVPFFPFRYRFRSCCGSAVGGCTEGGESSGLDLITAPMNSAPWQGRRAGLQDLLSPGAAHSVLLLPGFPGTAPGVTATSWPCRGQGQGLNLVRGRRSGCEQCQGGAVSWQRGKGEGQWGVGSWPELNGGEFGDCVPAESAGQPLENSTLPATPTPRWQAGASGSFPGRCPSTSRRARTPRCPPAWHAPGCTGAPGREPSGPLLLEVLWRNGGAAGGQQNPGAPGTPRLKP